MTDLVSELRMASGLDKMPSNYLGRYDKEVMWSAVDEITELRAACKAVCGVFEGQDDVPMYVQKCRKALKLK